MSHVIEDLWKVLSPLLQPDVVHETTTVSVQLLWQASLLIERLKFEQQTTEMALVLERQLTKALRNKLEQFETQWSNSSPQSSSPVLP